LRKERYELTFDTALAQHVDFTEKSSSSRRLKSTGSFGVDRRGVPGALCAGRLSITTISLRLSVGAKHCFDIGQELGGVH
jgi:hypothetical protein